MSALKLQPLLIAVMVEFCVSLTSLWCPVVQSITSPDVVVKVQLTLKQYGG